MRIYFCFFFFFSLNSQKKKCSIPGIAKMESNVLLTEKHIFSTTICWECLYLFPEKYMEALDHAG